MGFNEAISEIQREIVFDDSSAFWILFCSTRYRPSCFNNVQNFNENIVGASPGYCLSLFWEVGGCILEPSLGGASLGFEQKQECSHIDANTCILVMCF